MTSTRDALSEALKTAMKARDQRSVATLRMIMAKLKDKDIEARTAGPGAGIDEPAVLATLQGMIKQRRESIELYRQGNRQDLVDSESAEVALIERFLPQQMDESASQAAVDAAIEELGATGVKDMGRVIATLRARYAGQVDFGRVSAMVKSALASRSA